MEEGGRYLIRKKGSEVIREWKCVEVSDIAVKVENLVSDSYVGLLSSIRIDKPFWVLNVQIDTEGITAFEILEKLK